MTPKEKALQAQQKRSQKEWQESLKSQLDQQLVHSQISLNGAKIINELTQFGDYSAETHDKMVTISKFIVQGLHNTFVPPTPPEDKNPLVMTPEDMAKSINDGIEILQKDACVKALEGAVNE